MNWLQAQNTGLFGLLQRCGLRPVPLDRRQAECKVLLCPDKGVPFQQLRIIALQILRQMMKTGERVVKAVQIKIGDQPMKNRQYPPDMVRLLTTADNSPTRTGDIALGPP